MESKTYFQAHNDYFWEWEDGGEVLAIPNDSTIAYRGFVFDALEKLAPWGLPSFGSLLLAIIATNPQGYRSLASIYNSLSDRLSGHERTILNDAVSFLKLLTEMPPQYKSGKKRVLLLQAIFERSHNILSTKASINIYKDFPSIGNVNGSSLSKESFDRNVFLKDFRTIALLRTRFRDVNSILGRIAALPDIPEGALLLDDNDIRETDFEKDFIEVLTKNHKTFHVGSLIRHIWSGLNIPAHSALPSQQPIGGVSDLTNKGDFDKLLVSEFANDDLMFLSRLANNEALYIRREVPPARNDFRRIILIDVSLKCWGTPKTIAFSIMLAIARHPKGNIPCDVYAVGASFYPLFIDNIDGIIDGLQVLDGSIHCGPGLAAFFEANPQNNNREVFLITERTSTRHPEMLRAITDYSHIAYCLYTDADGNIEVYRKQQNSKKHLQHLQIPLEDLWKKTLASSRQHEVVDQYPILLRNSVKDKAMLTTSDGAIFQVTRDNVLLKLYDKSKGANKGWELVTQNVPFSKSEFEMGLTKSGDYIFLIFDRTSKVISLTNLTTQVKTECVFSEWQLTPEISFVFDNDSFHHKNIDGSWCISIEGDITRVDDIPVGLFMERRKLLSTLAKNYNTNTTVFKNITHVFVNQTGNLVFNVHELILKQNNHLKLEKTGFLRPEYDAEREGENRFLFSDGSVVEVHRAGVFILKSSNVNIPRIYISSVVTAMVGAATDEEFSGNDYYNRSLPVITAAAFHKKYIDLFIRQIQTGTKSR